MTCKFGRWPRKTIGNLFQATRNYVRQFNSYPWIRIGVVIQKPSNRSQVVDFFILVNLNLMDDLKKYRALLLWHFKLCTSFCSNLWIRNEVWKRSICMKIIDFVACVSLKFDGRPRRPIGNLFYATTSCVHYSVAICELKLELQSGNIQFRSNSSFFCPCDLKIWRMTSKSYKAHLLYHFKLCAAFRSHLWIQTGVTDQKISIWVKIDDFSACDLEIW